VSGARAAILVIDDDEDMRATLALSLLSRGYEIVTADGGETAVRLASARRFDLATCDMKMPGMDGLATIRALKVVAPDLRIVVVSGFITEVDYEECCARGACDYLRKPFSIEDLHFVIARALELPR
jgi:DNA-binding NtrC family response regulator